jgi:intraflagellar transport protein 88
MDLFLQVVSWLGVWFVKNELYEKAIEFFERASEIQPADVKWKLMVASCHRRKRDYAKALECYEIIHAQHPDDAECTCHPLLCACLPRVH